MGNKKRDPENGSRFLFVRFYLNYSTIVLKVSFSK